MTQKQAFDKVRKLPNVTLRKDRHLKVIEFDVPPDKVPMAMDGRWRSQGTTWSQAVNQALIKWDELRAVPAAQKDVRAMMHESDADRILSKLNEIPARLEKLADDIRHDVDGAELLSKKIGRAIHAMAWGIANIQGDLSNLVDVLSTFELNGRVFPEGKP